MAAFKLMAFLALLVVLLPTTALGDLDDLAPALSPFFDKICEEVNCGKGKCRANSTHPFNFSCECEPGWKKTKDNDEDNDHTFLPCIIPNCTLHYDTCHAAPAPAPDIEVPHNISVFDPCSWIYCGEGTCKNTSRYKHTCDCKPGFYNLLNTSYFPCFSNCTLGADCERLGIRSSDAQTSSNNETTSSNDENQAISFLPGKFHWMIILIVSTVIAIWK